MSFTPAFIFDMNGTMIDDMAFHTRAWHRILTEDLGADLTLEQTKLEMYGKNEDLLDRVFGAGKFTTAQLDDITNKKETAYQQAFRPHLKLIGGLDKLIADAKAKGVPMAIGTAAIVFNVDFVLDNLALREYFPVTVTAEDVALSKPHPETFLRAAELLGVEPKDCIVFEDSPKGLEAAYRAGMRTVVLTTMHAEHEFDASMNVIGFVKDYNDPLISTLIDAPAAPEPSGT